MSYLGADETAPETDVLTRIDERTAQIVQWQKDEDTRRKWTMLFTVGGALFAAVRLGIIAIPHLRRRSAQMGKLADPIPTSNPARRRRRR